MRQRVGPDDERVTTDDLIELAVVTPGTLAEEAAAHGLEAEELRHIAETPEHVASRGGDLPWLTSCACARCTPT